MDTNSHKHAYCIIAHNEPDLLKTLVNLIDDERTIGIESDFSLPIDWSEIDAPSEDVSE